MGFVVVIIIITVVNVMVMQTFCCLTDDSGFRKTEKFLCHRLH